MRFYQEITIIKTPEVSPYFIWSKLYTQLHLALVEQQNPDKTVDIGVSFPEYHCFEKDQKTIAVLGGRLRVFASSQAALEKLDLPRWLKRLTDYLHIKSIKEVPNQVNEYLRVTRYRPNMNMERLTRRFAKRKGISFAEAKKIQNERFVENNKASSLAEAEKHYANPVVKELPYIKIKSLSGNRDFSLFIDQQTVDQQHNGSFNSYGLSSTATLPNW